MSNNESSDFDVLWNQKALDRRNLISKKMSEIDKEYSEYFSKREKYNSVNWCYSIITNNNKEGAILKYMEESNLDSSIKREVEKAFDEVYSG